MNDDACVLIDGEPFSAGEARVSVFDRGFLYGDSVFETLRTYGGRPYAVREHLARLARSAERVFIPLPVPLETLERELAEAVRTGGFAESTLRVMITRGNGPLGLDPDTATHPRRLVIVTRLKPYPERVYTEGLSVITTGAARLGDGTGAQGAKLANYMAALLALREAHQRGADDALFVDAKGRVAEATTANIFAFSGDHLVTPPEGDGALAGITRAGLLCVAQALGLNVEVRSLPLAELLTADEAFISSTLRELVPVVRVDGTPLATGRPGPRTRHLHAAFRRHVAEILGLPSA